MGGAIRKVLPKNEHVALAIIGGYFSLYLLSSLMSGKKKEAPAASATSGASTSDGEIPSVDSPEFATWLATDGNIEKACKLPMRLESWNINSRKNVEVESS